MEQIAKIPKLKVALCIFTCAIYVIMFVAAEFVLLCGNLLRETAVVCDTISRTAINKLEYSFGFGKTADNFTGVEEILSRLQKADENIENVMLVNLDGVVSHSLTAKMNGAVPKQQLFTQVRDGLAYAITNDRIYVEMTLYSGKNHAGDLVVQYRKGIVGGYAKSLLAAIAPQVIFCAVLLVTFALILLMWTEKWPRKKKNKYIYLALLSILMLAFSCAVLVTGKDALSNLKYERLQNSCYAISNMLKLDYNKIVNTGIDIEKIDGVDTYVASVLLDYPELVSVHVYSSDGNGIIEVAGPASPDGRTVTSAFVGKNGSYVETTLADVGFDERYARFATGVMAATGTYCVIMLAISLMCGAMNARREKREKAKESVR